MDLCKNDCGRPVERIAAGLCNRCYQRAWYRANRATPRIPGDQTVTPVGYGQAHIKLARFRGKARDYSCVDCGKQALEWSYDGGSEYEQREVRIQQNRGKEVRTVTTWSPDINAYSPRCRPCHRAYDGKAA